MVGHGVVPYIVYSVPGMTQMYCGGVHVDMVKLGSCLAAGLPTLRWARCVGGQPAGRQPDRAGGILGSHTTDSLWTSRRPVVGLMTGIFRRLYFRHKASDNARMAVGSPTARHDDCQ